MRIRHLFRIFLFTLSVLVMAAGCSSNKNSGKSSSGGKTSSSQKIVTNKTWDLSDNKPGKTSTDKSKDNKRNKTDDSNGGGEVMTGKASYYADKFIGRKTASGEPYSATKMTAAHKTLPFGTMLRVTNVANGKSVDVKVNDRGPFVAGRIVDLSRAAAEKIDMVRAGVAEVKVQVLSKP